MILVPTTAQLRRLADTLRLARLHVSRRSDGSWVVVGERTVGRAEAWITERELLLTPGAAPWVKASMSVALQLWRDIRSEWVPALEAEMTAALEST